MKSPVILLSLLLWLQQGSVEESVTLKLRASIKPGQPVSVSRLYNEVFVDPAERRVLERLFNLFFKIPIYIVERYESQKRPPTLSELSAQFRLTVPGEADVLLTVMEADPRVPKFFRRDAVTKEIVAVEPQALRSNSNFSARLDRSLGGLENKPAPDFSLKTFEGKTVDLSSYRGRTVLVYFWFTGCPPCGQISPHLGALQGRYGNRKFQVLGLNADRVLEIPNDDAERAEYVRERGMNFTNLHLDPETLKAYGDVSIFPTLFLVGPDGIIRRQWLNYQPLEKLEAEIKNHLPAVR
ncbi:MAG TPA: TlpA disulfide reductase family protein [Acidobacteriota bacterium]|jgi:peroxiredoxin